MCLPISVKAIISMTFLKKHKNTHRQCRWVLLCCQKTVSFVRYRRGGVSPPAQQLRSNCCSFRRKQKTIAFGDTILFQNCRATQRSPLQSILSFFDILVLFDTLKMPIGNADGYFLPAGGNAHLRCMELFESRTHAKSPKPAGADFGLLELVT